MRKILFFIAGLLWLPAVAWPGSAAISVYGVWSGTVTQVVIPGREYRRYDVAVTMAPNSYRIDYDSLDCGGDLRLLVKQGRFFRFRDELNYGLEACSNGGRTELHFLASGQASFQWFDVNGVLKAEGRLKRTRQLMAFVMPTVMASVMPIGQVTREDVTERDAKIS
ncbi:MAG: hypothetical protein COB30_000625 [Ectothiorhodospiraceae bacterium]|nr:hypothetical protein [Ectothiorhodospiraceae bacterium]